MHMFLFFGVINTSSNFPADEGAKYKLTNQVFASSDLVHTFYSPDCWCQQLFRWSLSTKLRRLSMEQQRNHGPWGLSLRTCSCPGISKLGNIYRVDSVQFNAKHGRVLDQPSMWKWRSGFAGILPPTLSTGKYLREWRWDGINERLWALPKPVYGKRPPTPPRGNFVFDKLTHTHALLRIPCQ